MLWVETNRSGCKSGTGGRPGAGTHSRGPAFTSQQLQRGQIQPKFERLVLANHGSGVRGVEEVLKCFVGWVEWEFFHIYVTIGSSWLVLLPLAA